MRNRTDLPTEKTADSADSLELVGVAETAAIYGVPPSTIYHWRHKGIGPPGFRVGKHLKFRLADIRAHLDALARADASRAS